MKRRKFTTNRCKSPGLVLLLGILGIQISCALYFRHRLNEQGDLQTGSVGALQEPRAEKKQYKKYLFYDAGAVYHDMNFTCPVPWEWTMNVSEADAAWFNILNHGAAATTGVDHLNLGKLPLRIFMSLESEVYYPQVLTAKSNGFFDYLVDYRVWNGSSGMADIPAVYMLNPHDGGVDFRKTPRLPKRKDAYIAAFISNCGARNNRDYYLQELMQYMPMHSYGACHHTMDEPKNNAGKLDVKKRIGGEYHFWFTAENSNADSYVTEKIYDAFDAGVVPVYLGAPNVERFVPHPSSIIRADRYTPKELAALLNKTASDPKEYAKYFAWKKKPFTDDFNRLLRLSSRTVQCRLAMHLEGLDMEQEW